MAERKGKKTKKRSPLQPDPGPQGERASTVTLSHMTAVLENIEQQNRATIEAVFASEGRITARFDKRFEAIESRLTVLEIAVRQNSADIRQNSEDIRKNSEDIAQLQVEVRRLASILGADRDENAIQALERRVSALEARAGT